MQSQSIIEYLMFFLIVIVAATVAYKYLSHSTNARLKQIQEEVSYKERYKGKKVCNNNGHCDSGETCARCPKDNCCAPPPAGTITQKKTCQGVTHCTTGEHTTCAAIPVETCKYATKYVEHRGHSIPSGWTTCKATVVANNCTP